MRYLEPEELPAEIELLTALGAGATWLGRPDRRYRLVVLTVGAGPRQIAVKANAHADEPAGTVTCLEFARRLLTEPSLGGLAETTTFHLLPTANPEGLARNRGWLAAPGDLATWLRHVDRDPPEADREFGYGLRPQQAKLPECALWHGYLDRLPRLDGYASLHSMAFAGGALYLLALDPTRHELLLDDLRALARDAGLPLHDEDRGGRKGFTRLAPGFWTAPSREAMARYLGGGAGLRWTSFQIARRRPEPPPAVVSEIPQWWDPALADPTPGDRLRAEVDRELADRLAATADELERQAADRGHGTAARWRIDRELAHRRANVAALRRCAADWGDRPAARRDERQLALTIGRTRLGDAVLLARLAASEGHLPAGWETEFNTAVETFAADFDFRATPLETQVEIQCGLLVALARDALRRTG